MKLDKNASYHTAKANCGCVTMDNFFPQLDEESERKEGKGTAHTCVELGTSECGDFRG